MKCPICEDEGLITPKEYNPDDKKLFVKCKSCGWKKKLFEIQKAGGLIEFFRTEKTIEERNKLKNIKNAKI